MPYLNARNPYFDVTLARLAAAIVIEEDIIRHEDVKIGVQGMFKQFYLPQGVWTMPINFEQISFLGAEQSIELNANL